MLYPCICNVVISCWKSGAYGFVICRGGTDMCFAPGSGWKHLDLEQYRISGLTAKADVGWLWHPLAHVGMRNLQSLVKWDHIVGLSDVSFANDRVFSACIAGKQHEKQHKVKTIITSTRPLDVLYFDIFGPP